MMTAVADLTANAERLWGQWRDWAVLEGIAVPADPAFAAIREKVWEASASARNPSGIMPRGGR